MGFRFQYSRIGYFSQRRSFYSLLDNGRGNGYWGGGLVFKGKYYLCGGVTFDIQYSFVFVRIFKVLVLRGCGVIVDIFI